MELKSDSLQYYNNSYLSNTAIFYFHDYGGKSNHVAKKFGVFLAISWHMLVRAAQLRFHVVTSSVSYSLCVATIHQTLKVR